MSSFKSCEIRHVQHRKQSPSLPTLMLEFKPDAPIERARKRRSSRAGGLSSKDPWASMLLFRTVAEERYNIYDWQITLKPQLVPDSPESLMEDFQNNLFPMTSPIFGGFSNPFAAREARTPTSATRPSFLSRGSSQSTHEYTSTYPHAPRTETRPSAAMMSPSPSLRSRRSDVSSQSSSMIPLGFTSNHPQNNYAMGDLPSPASTIPSGFETQFIEGWTSAQGRSSTLSSHTRGSNSIASAVAAAAPIGATPPGPRETILDRAFQMRCIPGSEKALEKEEEKISSIARFEALMKEADERKRQKSVTSIQDGGTSSWDLDEESEYSSHDEVDEDEDTDALDMWDHDFSVPTPAQRALDYISGRPAPAPISRPLSPMSRSPPIPFLNTQAMSAFHGIAPGVSSNGLRPRTGTSLSQRDIRPVSLALPSRSMSAAAISSLIPSNNNLKTGDLEARDIRRRSSTSVKRLSFTEFAKRLSSTSSLLLVQTNTSSHSGKDNSRRTSSEFGPDDATLGRQNSVNMRSSEQEKRCGWRGSVGAFGGEGGFL
jgi:hypothetical protein